MTYIQNGNFRKVTEVFPLFLDILLVAHNYNVFKFVVMEVAGTEWHNKISKSNERRTSVGKQADDNVVTENSHGCLFAVLKQKSKPGMSRAIAIRNMATKAVM